jgi:hypothetical protein
MSSNAKGMWKTTRLQWLERSIVDVLSMIPLWINCEIVLKLRLEIGVTRLSSRCHDGKRLQSAVFTAGPTVQRALSVRHAKGTTM